MDEEDDSLFIYNKIDIPTVLGLLKNILSQYPDNGQIIKELVQNAEDAGATQVILVHDSREFGPVEAQNGVDLQRFIKGPSLCLYNNGEFTEEDWKGIRTISDSIKKTDPLKVGQFGLGFKSCFHMTDYVTIISGKYAVFMDPSEPESTMCQTRSLKRLTDIVPAKKCLELWGDFLTEQNLIDGYLPATIFWFPLRQEPSKISSTIYSCHHVSRLFQSFSVEASGCLTFLKSLERIQLKNKSVSGVSNTILEVALHSPNMSQVQAKRRAFSADLKECRGSPTQSLTCSYSVTVSTSTDGVRSEQNLRVLHYVPGTDTGQVPQWRGEAGTGHMPHVGIAADMCPERDMQSVGKIFCFLPLPPDPANNTNLPIQVHGFFCLDQNRRHVKWRTDEGGDEPDVQWNEELVEEAVTEAYFLLLTNILSNMRADQSSVGVWYDLMPDVNTTSGRWKTVASNIWSRLKNLPIIYSKVKKCMMTPHDVLTDSSLKDVSCKVADTVTEALTLLNTPLASVRRNVLDSLSSVGVNPTTVTPQLLRQKLSESTEYIDGWERKFRITLLEFMLMDEKYEELKELPFLPLNNGKWVTFQPHGAQPTYFCTRKEAAALVGLDHRILSLELPQALLTKLWKMASRGVTQLTVFSAERHFVPLLKKSVRFVKEKRPGDEEVNSWLEHIWTLLQEVRLEPIEELDVVPLSCKPDAASLIHLSCAIVKQDQRFPLSQESVDALSLLKVQVLHDVPSYVSHLRLGNYFATSDAHGVTGVLNRIANEHNVDQLAIHFNAKLSEGHIRGLSQVVDTRRIEPRLKALLRKLNLFRAMDNRNCQIYTSIDKCFKMVVPQDIFPFPVNLPEVLLITTDDTMHQLALTLGAIPLSTEELFLLALGRTYDQESMNKLIKYVLSNASVLNSSKIKEKLRQIPFVLTTGRRYLLPGEVYDLHDPNGAALLGEDLFPAQIFERNLPVLRELGLKTVKEMPRGDFIAIVRRLQSSSLTETEQRSKVSSLLRVMNQRQDCRQLCHELRDVPCVYADSLKPERFPAGLVWATSTKLNKPKDIKSYEMFKDVCGSVVPLVSCRDIPHVAESFGWNEEPDIEIIILHLKNIIDAYEMSDFRYLPLIKKTYSHLALYSTNDTLASLSSLPSVFTEYGFRDPKQVYVSASTGDLQLLPYMHPLPFELSEHADFFLNLGCFEKQSEELLLILLKRIQTHHNLGGDTDPEHDRGLVISILKKIQDKVGEIEPSRVLLPVATDDGSLGLVEIGKCSYSSDPCDWLDLEVIEELELRVVHSSVDPALAESLGVESLKKHLMAGEEAFMEWGQEEPITTRLHNLLRQYRDGVAIFKEMVQNADDAGASTISFLYDERQNDDARTRLLSQKLQECQGPALWAYNDASFTEGDFVNLRKLGGATKEHESTKIGKFGLGFSSVYNLTDVPSFVSGSSYVIFDPHLTYVKGKNKTPGVRFNFSENRNAVMLKKLCDQFKPFKDVFGCDIQDTNAYDGTLFRLPLRTRDQADVSKISQLHYGRREMKDLLKKFSCIIGEILLFTQHVKEIKVFALDEHSKRPDEKVLLFSSTREEQGSMRLQRDLVINTLPTESPMKAVGKLFDTEYQWNEEEFQQILTLDITVKITAKGADFVNVGHHSRKVKWLTSWHTGHGASCRLAQELEGKALPLAAVAVPVKTHGHSWKAISLNELPNGFYSDSHMHCFLPLPLQTSLMVQVNGFFEVASDRTSLLTRTEDDRIESPDWNATLMRDAVTAAYHSLLTILHSKDVLRDYKYHSLWPQVNTNEDNLVSELVFSFYDSIVQEDLVVFRDQNGWLPFSKCLFLEHRFHKTDSVGEVAFNFMRNLLATSEMKIMEMPESICCGFGENVSQKIISPKKFFVDYFLPNLTEQHIEADKRTLLILHILDEYPEITPKLRDRPCIATKPNGNLKKPGDLIDPKSKVACLYEICDERFPEDVFVGRPQRREVLHGLGMMMSEITVEMVRERAETVLEIPCSNCGIQRASNILDYMGSKSDKDIKVFSRAIESITFLPVKPKPANWIVSWEGDSYPKKQSHPCETHMKDKSRNDCTSFSTPKSMCFAEMEMLTGSTHVILGHLTGSILYWKTVSAYESLGVITSKRKLPIDAAIRQLTVFSSESGDNWSSVREECHQIYSFLEERLKMDDEELVDLNNHKILITKVGFIEPNRFTLSADADCAPDLFSAKVENLGLYSRLMNTLGIGQNFQPAVVFKALLSKKEEYGLSRVPENVVLHMSKLLKLLFKEIDSDSNGENGIDLSQLYLPDVNNKLVIVGKLCIDDDANLSSGKFKFLNDKIDLSQLNIKRLGLKTKSKKRLEESCNRLKFGQNELLTTRLNNILKEYPCDSGIMKELLQNADDAGATEIAFIKDFRSLPTEKIFDQKLAPLQGPALSIYNNKCFQEKDIEGIQSLGASCKIKDPTSTGQYGIGFNAVYHLTDAPSFITRGPEAVYGEMQKETMCLFDPHCIYDPEATPEFPGAQYINLQDLRKDYPDSFKGYLEGSILKEEGTVFRLPLRTSEESLISKNMMTCLDLEHKVEDFKKEMKMCLLFLRSVRKISIMHVEDDGNCVVEYSVEAHVQDVDECKIEKLRKEMAKKRECNSKKENREEYFTSMTRTSYEMTVTDTEACSYHWYVSQQLGAEESQSMPPEQVQQGFLNESLSLLPHAGVALLLSSKDPVNNDLMTTSCYLPLPARSNLPFCVNGHFALNSSRRDLWTGDGDVRATWNGWLMREVMAPAAVQAVNYCRKSIFLDAEHHVPREVYEKKQNKYYRFFPDTRFVSEKWKDFPYWFFKYVEEKQVIIFDVFTPYKDEVQERNSNLNCVGTITWHALTETRSQFPLYFWDTTKSELTGNPYYLLNSLKRLGMKIGSNTIKMKLKEAKFEFSKVTPDCVLEFFLSWTSNYSDKCVLKIDEHIANTPFLTVENACQVFRYLCLSEEFVGKLNEFPLLVTGDAKLHVFSESNPRFISEFNGLLPSLSHEFVHALLAQEVWYAIPCKLNVLKPLTLPELAARIDTVLSPVLKNSHVPVPFGENNTFMNPAWLQFFWSFVYKDIKRIFFFNIVINEHTEIDYDWQKGKQYLLDAVGEWALFPMVQGTVPSLISINNAFTVLRFEFGRSCFNKLPIPHPHPDFKIEPKLRLTATLENPESVLEALHYNREAIAAMNRSSNTESNQILEYFGEKIDTNYLCHEKLRSLPLYENVNGYCHDVIDKKIIVPKTTNIPPNYFRCFTKGSCIAILKTTTSIYLQTLYKHLDSNCLKEDLEIYAQYILPKFEEMEEDERLEHLWFIRDKLSRIQYLDVRCWTDDEREVISRLKMTPIILQEGSLKKAEHFYDPHNAVFQVMNLCNLPEKWTKLEWVSFLKHIGLKYKITSDMFLEYINSLSIIDPDVEQKSRTLAQHLFDNIRELKDKAHVIREVEFLVPEKYPNLEQILPLYKTNSGLASFSSSFPPNYKDLLWTTATILPNYASELGLIGSGEVNNCLTIADKPLEEKVFKHISNLCTELSQTPCKSGKNVCSIMDNIYRHLEHGNQSLAERIVQAQIPIIHLPELKTCVASNSVVQSLEDEIIPYLYEAPRRYGQYFQLFENMGVQSKATCETYAKVLNVMGTLNLTSLTPEDERCVHLAIKGMLKNRYDLKDLKVSELYLPTKEKTLVKSTNMYVADNIDFERAIKSSLDKPLFMGLEALKIYLTSDSDLVNLLPEHLKPMFLSNAVVEEIEDGDTELPNCPLVEEVINNLDSLAFKTAVLRVLSHHSAGVLSEEKKNAIMDKLCCISVKTVSRITICLKFQGKEVGSKTYDHGFHVQEIMANGMKKMIVYFCSPVEIKYISLGLCKVFRMLLKFTSMEYDHMMAIFMTIDKPDDIHSFLDGQGVRAYGGSIDDSNKLRSSDIGSYLDQEFLYLLDNGLCIFHKGEIVCMKKYILGETDDPEEEDIFIIVEVKRRVTDFDDPLLDEYEVNTGSEIEPLITVKAHQLYKFIRKSSCGALVVSESVPEEEEDEDTIMRSIRQQVKNIWKVSDERERRHLLRRLMLKWHPDKNPEKLELATRVMQYIQSLVARLERGETIPDEDDYTVPSRNQPSAFYEDIFRSPPRYYHEPKTSGSGARSFGHSSRPFSRGFSSNEERTRRADRPEAQKWMKQAEHDLTEAESRVDGSSCWITYMCHQGAEKALKAALYLKDRDCAQSYQSGFNCHSLVAVAQHLPNSEVLSLAREMESRVGHHTNMRYPTGHGAPCDRYSRSDADFMLSKGTTLLQLLRPDF